MPDSPMSTRPAPSETVATDEVVTAGARGTDSADAPDPSAASGPDDGRGSRRGYEVATPVFEGPFDLLLHLILQNEVDLWEIRLSDIVDAYLAELEQMQELDLEVATEFLLIAATLVELKARRLLPGSGRNDLDEELRYEERDLLLARLLDCKTFQDTAARLSDLFEQGQRTWARRAGPEEPFRSLAPDPLERVTPHELAQAAARALAPRPSPEVDTEHIAPIRVSVRDAVDTVVGLISADRWTSFRDLARDAGHRLEIIVRFLAVLELLKQGVVDVAQTESFGDLTVRAVAASNVDVDLVALEWDDDSEDATAVEHRERADPARVPPGPDADAPIGVGSRPRPSVPWGAP